MRKHAILLGAVLLAFLSILSYAQAQAPVPFINLPLMPDATAPGGPQFTLTVNGTGFVSTSVVNWNGSALATQFVSGSQLTAIVPAAEIATASTGWVTVVNPAPGGGTSNLAFFTVTANVKYIGFALASSLACCGNAASVAAGDFNGDGKLDLAVAAGDVNTVSILLGDGAGNFTLASSPAVGGGPMSLAVGDFNGDGKLDLAVVNSWSNTVSILLGDGAGNFTLASSPAVGSGPRSLAVGDFNGDGKLDLAVTNSDAFNGCGGQTVSILLGDGTGNFTLASSPAVGICPQSVAMGDFNGDGKLDLAVVNSGSNTVSILLGDGTGNFTLGSSPAVGIWPESVAVGDFNGDGKLDLAVVNSNRNSGTVSILLGDGTGNFTLASSPVVPWGDTLALGDFNGDGKLDLAVTGTGINTIYIFLGDGTGNFVFASSPAVDYYADAVVVGDFNGDGKMDLAASNFNTPGVYIVLQVPPSRAVTLSPTSLSFGGQLVGTGSGPQPVTLTNSGSAPLKITRIASSANFSQTNNCPSEVPPLRQCTINVIFKPHKVGRLRGAVTIKDNAPTSPQTVLLTGAGTWMTLLPTSLDFGDQKIGTTSSPQVATLTNYSKEAVLIQGIHIWGANAASFPQTNNCGTNLPAGGNCTINVTFSPKKPGPKMATLEVFDNGGASPQKVALSGTGTK